MSRLGELVSRFRGETKDITHEALEIRAADQLLGQIGAKAFIGMHHHGAWEGEGKLIVDSHLVDEETGEHRVETGLWLKSNPDIQLAVGVAVTPSGGPQVQVYVRSGSEIVLRSSPSEEGISDRIRLVLDRETLIIARQGYLSLRAINNGGLK